MKVSYIEIKKNEKMSNHMFFENENGNELIVIFPGGNNSCDRPLLYDLRKLYLDKNYDVLCISYDNVAKKGDPLNIVIDNLVAGVSEAISEVKLKKEYADTLFISRSFGNVISSELKIRKSLNIKKHVYISPTTEALKYIKEYKGFIVTSTNDQYITKEDLNYFSSLEDDEALIFEDGTHSLESNDIIKTVDFLKLAVKNIDEFISS